MKAKEFRQWIKDNVDDSAEIECVVTKDAGYEGQTSTEVSFTQEIADKESPSRLSDGKIHGYFTIGYKDY